MQVLWGMLGLPNGASANQSLAAVRQVLDNSAIAAYSQPTPPPSEPHSLSASTENALLRVLGAAGDGDAVARAERLVYQLRKYEQILPKFQQLIQQLCGTLNVASIDAILPAVTSMAAANR